MKKEQNKFDQTYVNSLYSYFHKNYKKELLDVENTPSKILIIDSCDDFRESSKSIIENKFGDNVEIIASKNPEEAMTLVIKNFFNPDLIIIDLNLHNKSGFDIINFFKNRQIYIPMLVTSQLRDEHTVMKALSTGFVKDYIVKPFNEVLLTQKIENLLSKINDI